MSRISNETKIKQGRCQGIGKDYVPYYKASEAGSIGTASMIPDPIEGRIVSVLSTAEKNVYYCLRWQDNVLHIREQYLLDINKVNAAKNKLDLKKSSNKNIAYTTDFLVDYKDGTQKAFSVKWKADMFDPDSDRYRYSKDGYYRLIMRQRIEQEYWESQGVPFKIVTSDKIDRRYAENIEFAMGYYMPRFIITREQKLMYLIAHKAYRVPMDKEKLNPKKLADEAGFDIEKAYEIVRKENYLEEG